MTKPSSNRLKNASILTDLPEAIKIGRFPWDEPDAEMWSRESMYKYLVSIFYEWGITRSEASRHLVESLADCCFSLVVARRAIKENYRDPLIGNTNAYSLQRSSMSTIFNIYKNLGLYPLKTQIEYQPSSNKPNKERSKKQKQEDLLMQDIMGS